jgi:hypothetical protein|tara:strand:+ start:7896 stop:8258 length:363 start_codon:yes stop_codon:yes gene_type:complete
MRNRPDGLKPEGRISRDKLAELKYKKRTNAEIETLRFYFNDDWFDDAYTFFVNSRYGRRNLKGSAYPLQKCTSCNRIWNYHIVKKRIKSKQTQIKDVEYWDKYKRFDRLPMEKVTCPNCK